MSATSHVQGGATNGKSRRGLRVLFADDNRDTLEMLSVAARLRGWEPYTAQSTEEIIAKVTSECANNGRCFDALVLDIKFDDGGQPSGIQAVRALRRSFPNIPVIFITGWTSKFVKEEALKVGQEVIVKPFDPAYVLDRAEIWTAWAGTREPYEGPERRCVSINRSGYYRRATDKPIIISPRVMAAVAPQPQGDK